MASTLPIESRLRVADSEHTLPPSVRGTVTVTIDVEDWHQIVTRRMSGYLPDCSPTSKRKRNAS
jgi:hypothetical protein